MGQGDPSKSLTILKV